MEVLTVGLCLEGTGTFNISLREFQLFPGLMVIALPNQIVEQRCFSSDFKAIFFAVSKNLLETLPKISNVLSLFFLSERLPVFQSYTAGAGDCEGISCIYQKTIEE